MWLLYHLRTCRSSWRPWRARRSPWTSKALTRSTTWWIRSMRYTTSLPTSKCGAYPVLIILKKSSYFVIQCLIKVRFDRTKGRRLVIYWIRFSMVMTAVQMQRAKLVKPHGLMIIMGIRFIFKQVVPQKNVKLRVIQRVLSLSRDIPQRFKGFGS